MRNQQQIEMIARALQAFMNAETWAESKRIVEAQSALLLTDETDFVLTILLQQYAHDQEAVRNLELHRELLQRCRAEGIEAAFAERLAPATTPDHPELRLVPLIQALINCDSPDALLTLVAEQPELLSDEIDTLLQQFLHQARAQGDAEANELAQQLEGPYDILRQLREMMRETGMDAQMVVPFMRAMEDMPPDALEQAALHLKIRGFVTAENWLEARLHVEEHPELLSDEVDRLLAEMITVAQKQGEEGMARHLQEHRIRLARARQEGLDAIAPLLPPQMRILRAMVAQLPAEARNAWNALRGTQPSPQQLAQLLEQYPELEPVLMQMQKAAEENGETPHSRLMPLMQALMDCDNPQAVLILVSQQPELLSDEMDALLQQSISQARAQGDAEGYRMAQLIEERLTTLRQLREAMGDREIPANVLEQAALMQSIEGLVSTPTWLEARFYVEEHPELLSDKADNMLAEMITVSQREASKSMTRHLKRLRRRLARARRVGLDAIAILPS